MASSSRTSLLAKVARLSTTNSSNSMTARCMPIFRRSFILLASRRGGFPQQRLPFPSELLLPRAFSTSSPFSASVAEKRRSSGPSSLESEDALSEDVSLASKEAIPDSRVPIHTLRGVIHENTLKAMTVHPFKHTHMSPVQEHILPLLPDLALPHDQHPSTTSPSMSHHKPRDLLVKAKTGTGKTMAFLVPAIEARVKAISDHVESSLEQLKATGLQPNLSDRLTATRRLPHNKLAR
ncbi:unnamed protein product [Cyclocybe aegerita]|uniref:DEAD/DEAH-box helicase domain-containing protein n=1 Tax=Cyclocybe aegerita TaxID=1973307 RepID=A0A8S0XYD7_CYCAE|nr:unnamed protein product [Cyclocybe aegerita]